MIIFPLSAPQVAHMIVNHTCMTTEIITENTVLAPKRVRQQGVIIALYRGLPKGWFSKRVVLANVPSFRCFVPGEHANVPSFRFSFRGNIRMYLLVLVFIPREHPPKPPFWKTTLLATPDSKDPKIAQQQFWEFHLQ